MNVNVFAMQMVRQQDKLTKATHWNVQPTYQEGFSSALQKHEKKCTKIYLLKNTDKSHTTIPAMANYSHHMKFVRTWLALPSSRAKNIFAHRRAFARSPNIEIAIVGVCSQPNTLRIKC